MGIIIFSNEITICIYYYVQSVQSQFKKKTYNNNTIRILYSVSEHQNSHKFDRTTKQTAIVNKRNAYKSQF